MKSGVNNLKPSRPLVVSGMSSVGIDDKGGEKGGVDGRGGGVAEMTSDWFTRFSNDDSASTAQRQIHAHMVFLGVRVVHTLISTELSSFPWLGTPTTAL